MLRYSDIFWSQDYASAISTLFNHLHLGCQQNQNHINHFVARHQAELAFGQALSDFPPKLTANANKNPSLISSTENAYLGINAQTAKEGEYHLEIAKNIDQHVILPFTNWARKHKERVEYLEGELKTQLRGYDRAVALIEKARAKYFNKVRAAEELKAKMDQVVSESVRRTSLIGSKPEAEPGLTKLKRLNTTVAQDMETLVLDPPESPKEEPAVVLAGDEYNAAQLKGVLQGLLEACPKGNHTVGILGTYERVLTGLAVTEAIQKTLGISLLEKAEQFGQDLISNGFLRLIGGVGSLFVNSSRFHYQWKTEAYKTAGEGENTLQRSQTIIPSGIRITDVLDDVKGMIVTPEPTEDNYKKILKEVKRCEEEYLEATKELDRVRLALEEAIEDHLDFMQRCELDRLRALKKVTLDFILILLNKFSLLKSAVDRLMLLQEAMDPLQDLEAAAEANQTGSFAPKVRVFEDYFDLQDVQVFGASLQSRCRFDHKLVPLVVLLILIHLDESYPGMSSDDERIGVWLTRVPLSKVHEVRAVLNTPGLEITEQLLSKYPPSVLASTLRLYLLELPNLLVPAEKYYLFKSLYDQFGSPETAKERIVGIENLLVDLPRPNIATLNYICSHLSSFVSIIAMNDEKEPEEGRKLHEGLTKSQFFKAQVCKKFALAILRPKTSTISLLNDTHALRLLEDLLDHKDEIFRELKKRNTVKKSVLRKTLLARSGLKDTAPAEPSPLRLSVDMKKEATPEALNEQAQPSKEGPEPDTVINF